MARLGNLLTVLRYLWDNSDQLIPLLERLPPAMRAAGEGLETAGDGAVLAGNALGGDAAAGVNAAGVLREATAALEQARLQLQAIAGDVRAAADALDQVTVPSIDFTKQRFNLSMIGLGQPELVTGVSVGQQHPDFLAPLRTRIRSGADLLDANLADDLRTATERLERMSTALEDSGNRIRSLGASLRTGGTALKELGS
ncbi:MAG TPA: hypothetical protein VHG28_01945 [Longimicrobiaceae bacterium]|nr:hypothetical protein [Longimicrobiaceae bacterium]